MRPIILPLLFVLPLAAAAKAQKPAPATATTTVTSTAPVSDADSRDTRERFKELLQRNPPELGIVLKLDPTLFNNQQYLATYPALASFIAEHPEVAHNPGFYLESVWVPGDRDRSTPADRMWQDTMQGLFILTIFGLITLTLTWLIRTLVEQRRWNRLSRVQTEVHSKLLDRFSANEDLLRYIETPAGRRFLESAPIPVDSGPRQFSAPIGRILFSTQAGLVIAAAGTGLLFVPGIAGTSSTAQPLYALGVVALCVGLGFVLSAIVSYVVSRRLKLLEAPEAPGV